MQNGNHLRDRKGKESVRGISKENFLTRTFACPTELMKGVVFTYLHPLRTSNVTAGFLITNDKLLCLD